MAKTHEKCRKPQRIHATSVGARVRGSTALARPRLEPVRRARCRGTQRPLGPLSPPAAFRAAAAHTAEPLPRSGRALVAAVVGCRRSATAGASMRRVCGRSTLPTRHQRGTVYERRSAVRSGGRTLPVPAPAMVFVQAHACPDVCERAFCLR